MLIPTFHDVVVAGAGFVIGAFTPRVGRFIKSGFVSLATRIVKAAEAEISKGEAKIVSDGEAAIKKV